MIVDDDDERLLLTATGEFRAEVVPEEAEGEWRTLSGPAELVEFYDPTDVFGDLADAIAEAFPSVAPEFTAAAADAEAGVEAVPSPRATRPTIADAAEADDTEDRPTA